MWLALSKRPALSAARILRSAAKGAERTKTDEASELVNGARSEETSQLATMDEEGDGEGAGEPEFSKEQGYRRRE